MGAIEARPVEVLSVEDAAECVPLSAEPGWNQTADDWRVFLGTGTVFGIRHPGGRLVATAAILPYGGGLAWISLVLVTASERGRGLATRLMRRCLDVADRTGLASCLDATPAGAHVYRALGFEPVCDLVRLRRPRAPSDALLSTAPVAGREADLSALLALDRETLRTDRSALISDLAGRPGSLVVGDGRACCLVRGGRVARHVGPVYGRDPEAVADLLAQVAAAEPGEMVVDAYAAQAGTRSVLGALGFSGERPFTRMLRGPAAATSSRTEFAHAGAGPEYG